jgi:hypothetical protein
MATSAKTKVMTFEKAQELSDALWLAFKKEGRGGIGNCKCPMHSGITYPPDHPGKCLICGKKLEHHVGL